nr:GNAT family N-acetyltransferase [Actinomycetota bacterium]
MPRETIAPLTTERLTLRLLSRSDAAALHRFRGDPGATRFLSHRPLTAEANTESGEIIGDGRTWNSSALPVAGVLPPGSLPVDQASLGYVLHPDHLRQGYGREAAGA